MKCEYCKKEQKDLITVNIYEGHKPIQRNFCCHACATRYQMSCEG